MTITASQGKSCLQIGTWVSEHRNYVIALLVISILGTLASSYGLYQQWHNLSDVFFRASIGSACTGVTLIAFCSLLIHYSSSPLPPGKNAVLSPPTGAPSQPSASVSPVTQSSIPEARGASNHSLVPVRNGSQVIRNRASDIPAFASRVRRLPDERDNLHLCSLFLRVREVWDTHKETHYVFTHGVSSTMLWPYIFRAMHPTVCREDYIPMRSPHAVGLSGRSDPSAVLSDLLRNSNTFRFDHAYREELLSVDAYFFNETPLESCSMLAAYNESLIEHHEGPKQGQMRNYFTSQNFTQEAAQTIVTELSSLELRIKNESLYGNVFVIAVPKKTLQNNSTNFAYLAHPYGSACQCHEHFTFEHYPTPNALRILDALQNDELVSCTSQRSGGTTPQVRLLTQFLTPDKCKILFIPSAPQYETSRQERVSAIIRGHQRIDMAVPAAAVASPAAAAL